MRRLFIVSLGILLVFVLGLAAAGGLGYYSHKLQLQPIYGLGERLDTKGRRVLGLPTTTVSLVDTIDTIFLRLRGKSYLMPDNDFKNGGGLTVWGDDVLVNHKSGRVYYLDLEAGLTLSQIEMPDNGRAGYEIMAEDKYPGRRTRSDALRYNDIEFIETDTLRGMIVSYTYVDVANECYNSRVSWLSIPKDIATIRNLSSSASDWELIYETKPCLAFNETRELIVPYMAGGRVAFKAPNLLYLGSGEYHLDGIYRPDAGIQSDDSDYGKTIEIDLIARTARHFSKGHRNLQGVTLDKQGRLWTTEHGLRGGDELNLVQDGENYGWPLENLGTLYSGVPAPTVGEPGRHITFRAPVFAWLPSAAVSSLTTIDGFHETWDGDLLIASLKGRTLFRARIQNERLVFLEEIPIGQRIRDVMQVAPDKIALWLDTNEMVIFEIEERIDPLAGLAEGLIAQGMTADEAQNAAVLMDGCSECHAFEKDVHGAGPSLHSIVDRPIASTAFAGYSTALREAQGTWNEEALVKYLESPEVFAPGTAMTGLGVGDPEAAADLFSAFSWLKQNQSAHKGN